MRHETVADLLLARVGDERAGLRTRERTWTWDEVVRESAARAEMIRARRTGERCHVGVLLANVPEYVFWLGGAALCGATVVGINPTRRGAALEAEVAHTDCDLVVTDRAGAESLRGLDIGVEPGGFLLVDAPEYPAPVGSGPAAPWRDPDVTAGTRFLLLFTSGTTGTSKAAICSQGRLTGLGYQNSSKYEVTAGDVCYCPMPLFHGNALMALWAPALVAGACVALPPKFSASRFLDDVRFFGATFFTYVGKAIGYVLAQPEGDADDSNSLTHAFGTEASPEDQAEFLRRFGCRLIEGYGSSEGAGMFRRTDDGPAGSLGVAAKDSVRVVDQETLASCPPAELDEYGRVSNAEAIGAIVDTEGAATFEGYYRNEAANAERVRNGWYWTGDLGYFDREGYFYFAGRSGDWVRVDGENVSALVLERALRRHPLVLAAAAFAVPDARSGDAMMAAVELAAGSSFPDLGLPAFLAGTRDLDTKGVPRFVRESHALPTTGSGKLSKKELQAYGWRTGEPVYRLPDRGDGEYVPMTERDKTDLRDEFAANGRLRFLP